MQTPVFLASLPHEELDAVMQQTEPWHLDKGAVVWRQHAAVPAIWMLDAGSVRFEADLACGRSIVSALASKGQCMGEVEVLGNCPALGTAIAVTDCWGWRLDAAPVHAFVARWPSFSRLMMSTLARGAYLSHLMYQHAMLLPPHQHLALAMLNLAHESTAPDGGPVLYIETTQEALAHMVASSRQFVSKHVRQWSDKGWIASRYGRLEIVNRVGLMSVLEQGLAPQLLTLLVPPVA